MLIDVKDEGTDSVADVKGLKVFEAETWDDLVEVYWYLHENPGKFKTVIVDTVTMAQGLMVEEVSAGKKLKGKQAGDWGTLTKQDWGTVASELKSWVTDMRDLPMETVFLAQDRAFNVFEEEGSDSELEPEIGPRLSPSVMSHLCAAVSVIGNTFIRERIKKTKVKGKTKEVSIKEYSIRLGPNASYITKLRKPKAIELPEYLSNPTFDELIEVIKGL